MKLLKLKTLVAYDELHNTCEEVDEDEVEATNIVEVLKIHSFDDDFNTERGETRNIFFYYSVHIINRLNLALNISLVTCVRYKFYFHY